MKLRRSFIAVAAAAALFMAGQFTNNSISPAVEAFDPGSVLDFTVRDIDGNDVKLSKYKGDVILMVNVASKCGYTPQYEGLQAIYKKYHDKGFYVLGFPANNFGGQEPGTNTEIKEFCESKFHVTFPMFAKISVKGDDIDPLYKFLTDKKTNGEFGGDITWNFNKFLVDRSGKVVARFSSKDTPESEAVTSAIEKYLASK